VKFMVVAENFPWPANGGGLIRLANSVEALARLGEVDLFTLCDPRRADRTIPPTVELARLETTPYPRAARRLRWRTAWLARGGVPLEVAMRRFDPAPGVALQSWASDSYDLVWFSTAATYEWVGRPRLGPTVIDLVDLEDDKERQRATLLGREQHHGVADRVRRLVAGAQGRLNARDWGAFQRSVAADVDRVVLASDLDVHRSGLPRASVVPNTLRRPARPLGRAGVGVPPTVLFQGSLNYAPNMDAADWLVGQVAPRLRARVGGCEIRLVGRPTPGVERLHTPPSVTVVGRVPEMGPELERADVAVVPIRYGSGTRVKILESFAHRIPVVSTTVGAEGLEVTDGVHLLVADDPERFAIQCERLLTEPELRKRVADAAEQLFRERYELSASEERIRAVVQAVVGPGSVS
jgi:glycosyltransferase involved in cell wall biosynthesis